MDAANQKEILTKYAALHHPDIARAYWWQGMSHYDSRITLIMIMTNIPDNSSFN